MSRTHRFATVLFALPIAILLPVSAVHAMWPQNGVSVATGGSGDQYETEIAGDGEGGAIVVWSQNRPGTGLDIMAQRVDAWGRPVWASTGVVICGAGLDQLTPQVVSDGAGGAIVTWEDGRGADKDIYAQRVSAAGITLWTANGVAVCTATNFQQVPRLARDGGNGAIITWEDGRPSPSGWDIYAQRVDASGNVMWTPNGALVCGDANGQYRPKITSDGAGGAIVAWEHEVSFQLDVRATRLSSLGSVMWGVGYQGEVVCNDGTKQEQVTITSDGGGGAIIAWTDYRTGLFNFTIFAQRMSAQGTSVWTFNGIDVCTATGPEQDPRIVSDGSGGAVLSWNDTRVGGARVYVQRVSSLGALQWTPTGVYMSDGGGQSVAPRLVGDGIGGAAVSWFDTRYQGSGDIFARRVNAAGAPQGAAGGVAMGIVPGFKTVSTIASDAAGGVVVAWSDSRNPSRVLAQAQRLDRFNNWGYPSADVVRARDIPGDQGGVINLQWNASRLDPWPSEAIDRYTVWRAIDPTLANEFATAGAPLVTLEELDPLATEALRVETVAGTTYFWQLMSTVDAYHLNSYAQTVPTLFDSTATSPGNHYFQVIAHGLAPSEYWTSAPVAGKSIDNIAPSATLVLNAQRVGDDVHLLWTPNVTEADFNDYAVFRGTTTGVQPIPGQFITSTDDTVLVDNNPPTGFLYYIVTARDVHGNQSAPSNEAGVTIPTAIGDTPSLTRLTLDANFPNPFNRTTELRVGLPRDSAVRLDVFDVAGRRVATRDVPRMAAGWQRIAFDGRDARGKPLASGVYFGRITAAGETQTMKMVIRR